MQDVLHQTILAGNELWRLIALFGVILMAVVGAKLGKAALLRSAELMERHGRLTAATSLRALAKAVVFASLAIAFPLGMAFLNVADTVASLLRTLQGVLISVAIGLVLYHLIDVITHWLTRHKTGTDGAMNDMLAPIVRTSLQVTVISLTVLQIVQSLTDKPLTSIIAGLGVGGLAVALAAQDTIKHFFGSVVLFADKPFRVGDRVTVDTTDGFVEQVGFRSSRIRTMEGELVSIPNGDLANKVIVNIGRRPYIRHRAVIGLTYDTPPDKLRQAVEIILNILHDHEGMRPEFPPRVVFDEFGANSLNLLVMFWYHPAEFWPYKQFAEKVNFQILEQFRAAGISFAFPTRTIHVASMPAPAGREGSVS